MLQKINVRHARVVCNVMLGIVNYVFNIKLVYSKQRSAKHDDHSYYP